MVSRAAARASALLLGAMAGCWRPTPDPTPPAPRVATVAYRVHHVDRMLAFYSAAFGVRFREVETMGVRSHFGSAAGLTLKFVPIRDGTDFVGYPVHQLGFEVADGAAIARVMGLARQYGGRVEGGPTRALGRLTGAVRDPDGNTIELYARP